MYMSSVCNVMNYVRKCQMYTVYIMYTFELATMVGVVMYELLCIHVCV